MSIVKLILIITMKTKIKIDKEFDAVKMMREIRDRTSAVIVDMNFEQLEEYFKKRKAQHIYKKSAK